MNKNAIIYTRVSTEEQGNGYSLPTQLSSCENYAKSKAYIVTRKFSDKYSGTTLDRPGLNALLKYVADNDVKILIVHDLDRLSRGGPGHFAIIEMELEKSGVQIEAVLGSYDDTPEGELQRVIKSAIAQYENRHRVERSRRGKIGRAQAGFVITTGSRAPYGYDYKSEHRKGWFVINEKEAKVVKQIYAWILEGLSCYEIAKKLHEIRELTRGDMYEAVAKKAELGAWSPSTIQRIVTSETYKGTWYYGKTRRYKENGKTVQRKIPKSQWIAVSVPPIIDETTWEKAQACLSKNKQNSKRNTKRKYLLRGLVFCTCGRRWTGRYKNHLNRAYYRCPKTEKERWMCECTMKGGIRQDSLESAVWEKVSKELLNPDYLETEISERQSKIANDVDSMERRLDIIEKAKADIQRKMGILLDQMLTEGFAKEIVEERKQLLVMQQKQLEEEEKRIRFEISSTIISPEEMQSIVQFAAELQKGLDTATFELKRQILELLNIRIDVISPELVKLSAIIPFKQEHLEIPAHPRSRNKNSSNGSLITTSPARNWPERSTSRWRG